MRIASLSVFVAAASRFLTKQHDAICNLARRKLTRIQPKEPQREETKFVPWLIRSGRFRDELLQSSTLAD
jgi:hypothetical protein